MPRNSQKEERKFSWGFYDLYFFPKPLIKTVTKGIKYKRHVYFEQDRNNLFCGFSNRTSFQIYYVSSGVEMGESFVYLVQVHVHIKSCLFRLPFHVLSTGYTGLIQDDGRGGGGGGGQELSAMSAV